MNIVYEEKIFCKNILYLMKRDNISEKEIMKIMHIGKKTFEAIKCGFITSRVTGSSLLSLCMHFHLKPHEFFTDLSA